MNIIIKTVYELTALPVRWYDWTAINVAANDTEEHPPIGYGNTEGDAIDDLVSQINANAVSRKIREGV